jgi:hypothetical protein
MPPPGSEQDGEELPFQVVHGVVVAVQFGRGQHMRLGEHSRDLGGPVRRRPRRLPGPVARPGF